MKFTVEMSISYCRAFFDFDSCEEAVKFTEAAAKAFDPNAEKGDRFSIIMTAKPEIPKPDEDPEAEEDA